MARKDIPTAVFLGIALCFAGLRPAAADTGNWPAPPQNNIDSCFGQGAPGDIGAPLEVHVSDSYGPYRGEQVVMVSDMNGMPVATLACNGPADQFRLRPGSYRVMAFVGDAARSPEVPVNIPPSGASVTLTMRDEPNQSFDSRNVD